MKNSVINKQASNDSLSDEDLAVLALEDSKFFTPLVTRYKERFFYYLKSFAGFHDDEVADVIQAAFIKIYKNLNSFDKRLKFSSWAYRIIHNEAIDELRRYKRNQVSTLDGLEVPDNINLSEDVDRNLEKTKVARALKELKNDYRQVLILRFFEQREYKEISDILQKPIGTVGTMIDRAKKQFKDKYEKYVR